MPRKRRQQLVSQMLEKLDAQALEEYEYLIRRYTRGRHGVYALYRNDKLYYVGLARNLQGRLKQHLGDRHRHLWNRFSVYLTIGDTFIKEMESLLLRIARPRGNKQLGKFVRCQDLHHIFRRDYKKDANEKYRQLVGRRRVITDGLRQPGHPPLWQYVNAGMERQLKAWHKGKIFKARVQKNGRIKFQAQIFDLPSQAAKAALGGTSVNGWSFWRYERAPGDWIPLKNIRQHR